MHTERYQVKWSKDRADVRIKHKGYLLELLISDEQFTFLNAFFNADHLIHRGQAMMVTGRSLNEYDPGIRALEINPALQYIEAGAGLGEFIPYVASKKPKSKPIVIDPADYELMHKMLVFAGNLDLGIRMEEHIRKLAQRCETILDPKKVRLYNCTLDKALEFHPYLHGIADVVVDNAGASHYSPHQKIWELERQLLKPDGILFSEVVKFSGIFRP